MNTAKRLYIFVLALLSSAPGLAAISGIETEAAQLKEVPTTYLLEAVVEATQKSTISAQTSGVIKEVHFDVNDFVRKGELVVLIDDTQQRADLRQAEAALNEARARLQEAKLEFERVREVFGDTLYKDLLPLSASLGGVKLSGFISRPDLTRKSRGWQYIFLNGRPIQARSLGYAIMQGYANLIPAGSYPVYCLFVDMDPALVDVNVHPAKMEVRFANERSIYYFFINSVQSVLKQENVIPAFSSAPSGSAVNRSLQSTPGEIMNELKSRKRSMARYSGDQLSLTYFEPENSPPAGEEDKKTETSVPLPVPAASAPVFSEQAKFWQIHNRYILSEIKSGLVIIDQHVAHERVLYERILKVLQESRPSMSQKLLFPQKLTLNYEDFSVFKDIYEVLNQIGFSIKVFSGTTIVIEAMPADVKVGRESQILLDIIDYYRNRPLHDFNHNEKVAAAYACKNAVKSGEPLSQQEMQDLVDQLFACESPFFCPHGRPVIVTMDLDELDRKFKRIS